MAAGILLGIFLRWWASARVTRPLARLTAGVREVAAGNLSVQLATRSRDETGQAIRAFNDMTRQLAEQRRELLQAERVTAWREIARRVAHEVKEQLFPLQVAVESLRQAREQKHEQFDPVFLESLATLTAELEKLKTSVTRFSDFAKMPAPRTEPVNVNDALRTTVQLFEPQFSAMGRPPITTELFLDHGVDRVAADPELLRRALENLLLRSRDAMPSGGTLSIRTGQRKGFVRIEISHTGTELQPQEGTRLFTEYYDSSGQSAGLGLATVQAIVSDHGGRISAESAPGDGTTFYIDLPSAPEAAPRTSAHTEPLPPNSTYHLPETQEQGEEMASPPLSYGT